MSDTDKTVAQLQTVAGKLIERLDSFPPPADAQALASALVDVQRATGAAFELAQAKLSRLPTEATEARSQLLSLAAFNEALIREFEAGGTPTSTRIAARIRTALRDAVPGWEPPES